ncbi:hydrolase [Streptomyces phage Daubenski]|uniref:Hydrolase n=1 Tax=Streptomyces phage Daubenski TaxID=2653725 RepID=A0A5Q2WIP1_9CAUD|nr:hydrolase [Streptomyces phage Daubenski]QGH76417.1 hydrolase [Streptomyces phage Daubenski]
MANSTPLLGAGNVTTASNSNATSITVNKPANLADGHYMFAAILQRNAAGTWTVPSGWTAVGVTQQDYVDCKVYYKYVPSAAAESATNYTWTTNKTAERIVAIVWLQTNTDGVSPIDALGTGVATAPNRTSMNFTSVTAVSSHATLIAVGYSTIAGGASAPIGSTPTGMTEITNVNIANATPNALDLKVSYQILSVAGATGTRTTNFSPAASGSGGFTFTINPVGDAPPTTVAMRQGLCDKDKIRVLARTSSTSSVRLAVSLSSDMSSPVYSSSVTPDSDGYSKLTVTGLSSDTKYWYCLELNGVLNTSVTGVSRTFPVNGSFSFLAASCSFTASNHAVFDGMRTRTGPDSLPARFFAHLGDVHYEHASYSSNPIAPNDPVEHRTNYENSLMTARQQALWRDIPVSHTYSDNDFCGSNSDSTYAARPAIISVRHQIMIDPPLPDSGGNGLWRTWVVGRVRFIQTDSRTYMSAKGSTDNSSKTMLGAEQKAWLKTQLLQPELLKVWFHDQAWGGVATNPGNNDTWQAFNTERVEIGNFISSNQVKVVYIHGDSHRLSADDGVLNTRGGFPTISCAPMDQSAQGGDSTGEANSAGVYPAYGVTQQGNHYGWFDVDDDGYQLSLIFKGYDSTGTQRVTMTVTVSPTVATGWGYPL